MAILTRHIAIYLVPIALAYPNKSWNASKVVRELLNSMATCI
jgi:hypothetical protein